MNYLNELRKVAVPEEDAIGAGCLAITEYLSSYKWIWDEFNRMKASASHRTFMVVTNPEYSNRYAIWGDDNYPVDSHHNLNRRLRNLHAKKITKQRFIAKLKEKRT